MICKFLSPNLLCAAQCGQALSVPKGTPSASPREGREVPLGRGAEEEEVVDPISAIGGYAGGIMPVRTSPMTGAEGAAATPAMKQTAATAQPSVGAAAGAGSAAATQLISSQSISQSSETLLVSQNQSAAVSNELLGAVLLMLLMEYMKTENEDEKKGLLALMAGLVQLQQQNGAQNSSTLYYSSSSLNIDSTQIVSTGTVSNAYTNAGVDPSAQMNAAGARINAVA